MMMPANYSVIAENEMTYVTGGSLFTWAADNLPAIWDASMNKTFTTNLVKIIGNTTMTDWLSSTLGVMFGGSWGDGATMFGEGGTLTDMFSGDALNNVMTALGGVAAVYTLGTDAAATKHNKSAITFKA